MTRRLNLADGEPFALVTVWCPEALASKFSRDDVEARPFYELLDVELGSARQRIRAGAATAEEAELLGMLPGGPVLRCRRLTEAADGRPVLASPSTPSPRTAPSSWSTCRPPSPRSPPAACVSWRTHEA